MKYYIITLIILFCFKISTSQTIIADNSWLLAVSPDSKGILYLKADVEEMDEYIEGKLYLYDIPKNSHSLLNKRSYMLNFTQAKWINDDSLFISNGSKIESYCLSSQSRKLIYCATKNELISSFDISWNKRSVVL